MTVNDDRVQTTEGIDMDTLQAALDEAATARLRALPGIIDGVVVRWMGGERVAGPIAYVVGDRCFENKARDLADIVVRVTAVPICDDGLIDFDQLQHIPQVSEYSRHLLEAEIATDEQVCDAKVSLVPCGPEFAEPAVRSESGAREQERRTSTGSTRPAHVQATPRHRDENHCATLFDVIQATSRSASQRVCGEYDADGRLRTISYEDLWADARRYLGTLQAEGGKKGDLVFVAVEGVLGFLRCYWAVILGGMIPVPLPAITSKGFDGAAGQRLQGAASLLHPRFILCDQVLDDIAAVAPCLDLGRLQTSQTDGTIHRASSADTALILLTSGSTGLPKAVVQTHESLLAQAYCAIDTLEVTQQDVSFNWFPLDHVGAIHMFHVRDLIAGIDQYHCATEEIVREPLRWLDRLEELRASITWSPNFACGLVNRAVSEAPGRSWDLSALRVVMNAGEAIGFPAVIRFSEVIAGFGAAADTVRPAWGMSETCSAVTYTKQVTRVGDAVSVGAPVAALGVRIIGGDSTVLDEGQEGELQVSGPVVTAGYLNNDDANSEAFTADGWFRTGDLARLDEGNLTITGRRKDIVIINGLNVACQAIEETIEQVPGVLPSYVAVTPLRDDDSERAVVFYVADSQAGSQQEISGTIRARLLKAHGINPTRIIQVDREEIPKTSIGKIQRSLLGKRLAEGHYGSQSGERSETAHAASPTPGKNYRRVWQRRQLDITDLPATTGTEMIVGNSHMICEQLAQSGSSDSVLIAFGDAYQKLDNNRYVVRAEVYEDYRRVFEDAGQQPVIINRIIHAGAFGPRSRTDLEGSHISAGLQQGFLSAVHLLRASHESGSDGPDEFAVLTSGVHSVEDDERVAYERTPIAGLVRSASSEWPGLRFVHVDTELTIEPAEAARLVGQELRGEPSREEVAYRHGARHVPGLVLVPPNPSDTAGPGDSLCVVVGGLGGVGQHLILQVAEQGYQRILIIGRRKVPPTEIEKLNQRYACEIHYAQADLTSAVVFEHVLATAERELGMASLIVEAAGSYNPGDIGSEISARQLETLQTKLLGGWALHRALAQRPGTRLVRSSSAVTFFGGSGISTYAAANAFTEGLTRYETVDGWMSECIAWSIWAETGVSRHSAVGPLMARQGYVEMLPRDAAQNLNAAHDVPGGCVYVSLNATAPAVSSQLFDVAGVANTLDVQVVARDGFQRPDRGTQDELGNEIPVRWERVGRITGSDHRTDTKVRPSGPVAEKLLQIWQETLQQQDIGADDSFFELGGASLQGSELMAKIEKRLGHRFGFTALMDYPTINAQAQVLAAEAERAAAADKWTGRAIRLNASGQSPLFAVHPLFGLVYPYVQLAGLLPSSTFYAFQASGFEGGRISQSIPEMASVYIAEMKRIQPSGPYAICGWSLGSLIALEMAQQLVRVGEQVSRLVIIDQATDSVERFLDAMPIRIQLQRFGSILNAAASSYSLELRGSPRELLAIRHPRSTLRFTTECLVPMLRVAWANRKAATNYPLEPYPGAIQLIHTNDPEFTAIEDDRLGWDKIAAGEVTVRKIAGSHLTLHEPPYVQQLASAVKEMLAPR